MTDDRRKRFPLGSPHSQDLWHLFSPFCLCTVAKTRNYPNITRYSARAFLVETLKEQKASS